MSVFTLGLNHHSAPLDLRGRLAFAPEQMPSALRALRERLHIATPEAALVSTCNRTELYVAADPKTVHELVRPTMDWLAEQGGVSGGHLQSHTYVRENRDAARHAFRVASGLDSMVLGEPQILGQMKQAVRQADEAGTLGTTLHQLFQRSFSVAKEVRTATEIGSHSISMAAAAVRLASQIFEDLADIHVLFVGAGEMIELVATHFSARTPRSMAIANRTLERGEHLASRFGAQALRLADLPQRLHEFDAVISCTASSLPIIGLGAVESALKQRRHRPMFMVDLAVPRDIEPEVAKLRDVYMYTVDDLSAVVQSAGEKRQAAVQQAEAIIDAGVQSFAHWLDQRAAVPLIQALNRQAEDWTAIEMQRARRLLARGEPIDSVLEALSRGLTHKMLHGTLAELHAADGSEREHLAETVSRLFLRQSSRATSAER
ncbi:MULTISPECIES: glutamyl-tRNA reductase [Rubrivivax]|uniref:Glutamyl-tRNA reductase n=1 Tax=Rubrivivax benzoatilyticus TaxID=316997 RepID=A0ABX0HWU8_9BURK|nr:MULTISPECIES: glutamyl-tRNA reductase [Rubrivivax]MCD0420721.1 glutamyl-tRNA reductase [Rubrivivax sp. JA1024]NHK97830.1 glutamyl-tRNA reductase [Rubrivivax benzoatilyticus]NHL23332.1 glutamyl-tRNA reductase [Rubrivivax benzoatilyticus]